MRMRRLVFCSTLVTAGLVIGWQGDAGAADPNIAYDEIVRFVVSGTPPPIGSFDTDYAAIAAPKTAVTAKPAAAAQKKRGLFGGIVSALVRGGDPASAIVGNAAGNAAADAGDAMATRMGGGMFEGMLAGFARFTNGTLLHYAYYNGYERIDDVQNNTATILKCAQHQRIALDLTKKTYHIENPDGDTNETARDRANDAPSPGCMPSKAPRVMPGTAVMSIASTTKVLAPAKQSGILAHGYVSTNSMAIEKATGSCRNASFGVAQTAYFSDYPIAHAYCALPKSVRHPETVTEMMPPPEGCKITPVMHASGPMLPSDRLALYQLMTMGGNGSSAPGMPGGGVSFVTERGNIKTLGTVDASLFEIPADYKKAP